MGNLGLRTFRTDALVGGLDLAAYFVLGKFQRFGTAWSTRAASSSDILLSSSFRLRSLFYLQGSQFTISFVLTVCVHFKDLFQAVLSQSV